MCHHIKTCDTTFRIIGFNSSVRCLLNQNTSHPICCKAVTRKSTYSLHIIKCDVYFLWIYFNLVANLNAEHGASCTCCKQNTGHRQHLKFTTMFIILHRKNGTMQKIYGSFKPYCCTVHFVKSLQLLTNNCTYKNST